MNDINRLMFIRPLSLAIFMSVTLELINYIIFTLVSGTSEYLLGQFVWTVLIGGLSLGAILGVFLDVILVGRLEGREAIKGTVLLSTLIIGVSGKLITLGLLPVFIPVSIASAPFAYFFTGLLSSALGGLIIGYFLFTDAGNERLAKLGL